MTLFDKFGLSKDLLESIKMLGFAKPTQIQETSIPAIIQGRDVIGESATGSGKTLAFGCGIIDHLIPHNGLQALVLTPTRELAEQVKEALKKISHKRLFILAIYGGVSINPQIEDLRKADVVVATPGRLKDHLQRRTINLSKIKLLVLDEADRMLDMGFIDDVEDIIKRCPNKRQTLFFSATLHPKIKQLARRYMVDPVNVEGKKMVDPAKLKQVYFDVEKNMKMSLLVHLIKSEASGLVMVFCNTRRTTDFVAKNLRANHIDAVPIHGGFTQNKRSNNMGLFNKAKVGVLVCTDVAARGLHINNVSHIYNFDIPKDPKDYVHRIGRTARAGEEGKVINLLCDYDHDNFSAVLREYSSFHVDRAESPEIKKAVSVRAERSRGGFSRGRFSGSRPRSYGSQGRTGDSRPQRGERPRSSSQSRSRSRSGSWSGARPPRRSFNRRTR